MLRNVVGGAKSLQASCSILINSANLSIKMCRERLKNEKIANEMSACQQSLSDATKAIEEVSVVLSLNPHNKEAKESILKNGKVVMKSMVRLIQLNDLYEVTLILKRINLCRMQLSNVSDIKFSVEQFHETIASLNKLLLRRLTRVNQTLLKNAITTSVKVFDSVILPLAGACQKLRCQPNNAALKQVREQ